MGGAGRTILVVIVAASLTGCAGGTGSDVVGAPPDDATAVVGASTCTLTDVSDDVVDDVRVIVERFECEDTMSDPRVTGTETLLSTSRIEPGAAAGTWSAPDAVLTTDGGTWRGWAQGVVDLTGVLPFAEGVTPFNYGEAHYVGEGAYQGLEYHVYVSGSNSELGVAGWITSTN